MIPRDPFRADDPLAAAAPWIVVALFLAALCGAAWALGVESCLR